VSGEPAGATKWLIVLGMVMLLLAALAAIMFAMPAPARLNSESAFLIPLAFVVFTLSGLGFMVAGLLVGRASTKRQSRV